MTEVRLKILPIWSTFVAYATDVEKKIAGVKPNWP